MLKFLQSKLNAIVFGDNSTPVAPQKQEAPKPAPAQDPILTITDSPWGHDVTKLKQQDFAKWQAACEKVKSWQVLWEMGHTSDIPSAFHAKFQAASRGDWDVKNYHYALIIMSLMQVLPTAQAVRDA